MDEQASDTARPIHLEFVGSGDAFGSGGRFQTCFRLITLDAELLIDCGATSLTALKRRCVDPNTIGAVVLTHLHGDHFGGIPFLILDGQFRRRERPLLIVGPPGTKERVEALMETLFPGSVGVPRRFETNFLELEDRTPTPVEGALVTSYAVEQPGTPACALRIECAGRTIVHSGDTAWSDDLFEVTRGADVFICEAYFFDKQVPYHLDHETLRRHRGRLDCKRIVLTHMGPDMLANQGQAAFDCAYDGMTVSI
jgi:ribonuclease BN (tRNA processing enzyme)